MFGKRFGSAILPEEKAILETLASRRAVTVNFAPLSRDLTGKITTYQFTDNRCPFFDSSASRGKCSIYRWRPLMCRAYPLMPYGVGDCSILEHTATIFDYSYTPEQVKAGNQYMLMVAQRIKSAAQLYSPESGKWRPNHK
jgi:Fe-S-cluster containining protein